MLINLYIFERTPFPPFKCSLLKVKVYCFPSCSHDFHYIYFNSLLIVLLAFLVDQMLWQTALTASLHITR